MNNVFDHLILTKMHWLLPRLEWVFSTKYLLTVAGAERATEHGRMARPPLWLTIRVLFFVRNWLSPIAIAFLCAALWSLSAEDKKKEKNKCEDIPKPICYDIGKLSCVQNMKLNLSMVLYINFPQENYAGIFSLLQCC